MFSHTYCSNGLMVFIKPHLCGSVHERTFHLPTLCPQGKLRNMENTPVLFFQHYNQKDQAISGGEGVRRKEGASHACFVSGKSETDVLILYLEKCEYTLSGLAQSLSHLPRQTF